MSDVVSLVLAAGHGTRMRSAQPKALLDLCGAPLVEHVLNAVREAGLANAVVVVGHCREQVETRLQSLRASFDRLDCAVQEPQNGTGHAVMCARECLEAIGADTVLILPADVPLIEPATLKALLADHANGGTGGKARALTVLSMELSDPTNYGRVVRGADGQPRAIVEHRDADSAERQIREVNSGVFVAACTPLLDAVQHLQSDNAQNELYLTDVMQLLVERGLSVGAFVAPEAAELAGANDRAGLALLSGLLQDRIQRRLMAAGVSIVDPASTYIEIGVEIGADSVVHPFSVLRRGVRVGCGCEVGPFSHLRAGTVLDDRAEVGNFVEVKNSHLGAHTKAKHLTYLGDASIGAGANIGAGTITANYDGKAKHRTTIADGAFIGSGTILVAPVSVGKAATTGAGAVVTRGRDVAPGDTVVGVPARSVRRAEKTEGGAS